MSASEYQNTYKNQDFSLDPLEVGEYEDCTFINCNFAGGQLNDFFFLECEFVECDLSNAQLLGCRFREVEFRNCKMLGLHFEECDPLTMEADFDSCQLESSSFYGRQRNLVSFKDCSLKYVDFTGASMPKTSFQGCDLKETIFYETNLEGADFRKAKNIHIDPEINRLKKSVFSMDGLQGLVWKWEISVK